MPEPSSVDGPNPHDSPVERRLRAALAAQAGAAPLDRDRLDLLDDRIGREQARLRDRRRAVAGTAATVAVAAGGGLTYAVARREPDRSRDGDVRTTSPDRPTDPPSDTEGSWRRIEPAPLSPRRGPAVVWAGDRLVVLGGEPYVDGPVSPEGLDHLTDGASWDPRTGGWTAIPTDRSSLPLGLALPDALALWTGREVVLGPVDAADAATRNRADFTPCLVAFDPATGTRRRIVLGALGTTALAQGVQAALVGPERLVVGVRFATAGATGHEQDVVVLDLVSGERTPLPPGPFAGSPYPDASGEVTLTAVDDRVVATPNWDLRPWVLDVAAGTWTRAPSPGDRDGLHLPPPTAIDDGEAISLADLREPDALKFAPGRPSRPWQLGAANPVPPARWAFPPRWSGRELLVPGAAYDPGADRWRAVDPPPRGPDRQRDGLRSAWTGDALLLFGGEEYGCPDAAACDRSAGPDTLDGWLLPFRP